MYHYAQLNKEHYCTSFSTFEEEVESNYLAKIESYDKTYLGRKYDIENNLWSDEWLELQPNPNPIPSLEEEVGLLKQTQFDQDLIIDSIVFEIIPNLESQIARGVAGLNSLRRLSKKEVSGMAAYLAKKIIEGRDYAAVFKTNAYKPYQDEVDIILKLEGFGQ